MIRASLAISLLLAASPLAHDPADSGAILTTPPVFERSADITVPLRWRGGKLALDATANGVQREFLLDTGSTTILSADLARELDLTVLGRNVGQDANGRSITMDIARLEQLQIGGLTVRNLPVLIFDFSALEIGSCVIGSGVIGSDLLPAGAWTIDMQAGTLSLSDHARIPTAAPLETYGYPFTPIVVYQTGALTDRAMIDTGGTGTLTLYDAAMDGLARSSPRRTIQVGQAVAGESAGGRGDRRSLRRTRIEDLAIGTFRPGPVIAETRAVAPTLIGVDILRTHRLALDQPNGTVGFEPREQTEVRPDDLGLSIEWVGGEAIITRVMANSPAARAGLRLGDRVLRANGRDLTDASEPCGQALWLIETLSMAPVKTLTTAREADRNIRLTPTP